MSIFSVLVSVFAFSCVTKGTIPLDQESDTARLSDSADTAQVDADNDNYTSAVDCNDFDPAISPAAEEIWYDGIDQNCNDQHPWADWDQDLDQYFWL